MENENSQKTEPRFRYFGSISRITLIIFLGFSIYLFISTVMMVILTKPRKEVSVPNVVGKQFNDAYNGLVRKGIHPEIKFHEVNDLENGIILNQYPESGTIIPEGNTLKLTVSRSGYSLEVPNLVGKNLPVAKNNLKNLHFHGRSFSIATGVISYMPSEKTAENIVIGQSPKAGEHISPDQKVNLLVSSGSQKENRLMPAVTGQSIDLCHDLLAAKGFTVVQEVSETWSMENSGTVLSQNPGVRALLPNGAEVKLRVAWYPLKEHSYQAYEKIDYTIPEGQSSGLFEAIVEDDASRRVCFSRPMKGGQRILFVFHRTGNARVSIMKDKETVGIIGVNVEQFN